MNYTQKNALVTLAGFVCFLLLWGTGSLGRMMEPIGDVTFRYVVSNLLWGVPLAAALCMMHKPSHIASSVGLCGNAALGYAAALIAVLPMVIGFAVIYPLDGQLTAGGFIRKAVLAGFFEELFFRGFLFGQLFRYARWGFIPAVLTGGLLFGAMHIYQGHDLISSVTVLGVTALGAILFSWLYAEWKYNIWIAVGMHTCMNGLWVIFTVDETASGNMTSNILRAAAILLSVALTIIYKKRNRIPWEITMKTLWVNK